MRAPGDAGCGRALCAPIPPPRAQGEFGLLMLGHPNAVANTNAPGPKAVHVQSGRSPEQPGKCAREHISGRHRRQPFEATPQASRDEATRRSQNLPIEHDADGKSSRGRPRCGCRARSGESPGRRQAALKRVSGRCRKRAGRSKAGERKASPSRAWRAGDRVLGGGASSPMPKARRISPDHDVGAEPVRASRRIGNSPRPNEIRSDAAGGPRPPAGSLAGERPGVPNHRNVDASLFKAMPQAIRDEPNRRMQSQPARAWRGDGRGWGPSQSLLLSGAQSLSKAPIQSVHP